MDFWSFLNDGFMHIGDIKEVKDGVTLYDTEIWSHSGQGELLRVNLEHKYNDMTNFFTHEELYDLKTEYHFYYSDITRAIGETKYRTMEENEKRWLANYILSLGEENYGRFLQQPEKELQKTNKFFTTNFLPRALILPF